MKAGDTTISMSPALPLAAGNQCDWWFCKEAIKRNIADIETACVSTKCGHYECVSVTYEATPPHSAPAGARNARAGVKVPRYFPSKRASRFMREGQARVWKGGATNSCEPAWYIRIMIALNPNCSGILRQRNQAIFVSRVETVVRVDIVKTIAKRDQQFGL
jgi:hypothetical protein